jgi:hypothetical protein
MGAGSTETSAKMFNTFGRHVIGELYECTPSLLKDLNKISNVVKSAALNAGATIVGISPTNMIAVTAYHTFWSSRRVIYQSTAGLNTGMHR